MSYRRKLPAQAWRVPKEFGNPADWPEWMLERGSGEIKKGTLYAYCRGIALRVGNGDVEWAKPGEWIILEDGELKVMRNRDFNKVFGCCGEERKS